MEKTIADLKATLLEIYSETTVAHILHPRNTERVSNPDGVAACRSGCGETMKIWLKVRNQVVENAAYWTDGCAATIACGSMVTELVKDKTVAKALDITGRHVADALVELPDGNFHCAQLAADTLAHALKDYLSLKQQPWKKLYR